MTPADINIRLTIPEWDTSSSIKTEEAAFIYNLISKNKITRTLETGFAFAKSASHIIAATESIHVAIDPFQSKYQNLGLRNIEALGMKDLLDFRPDFSHNVLPALVKEDRKFDFIFIDGDHKFDGVLVDFYFGDLLLEKGGLLLMHDTWMRSTRLVMSFIRTNRKDYHKLKTPLRNLALYQKIGTDDRSGMYFREFYTFRSRLTFLLITWMSSGRTTLLKRIALRVKTMVR